MLKYVAVFSFEVGGGHTPLSLSCCSTLLLARGELQQLQLQKAERTVRRAARTRAAVVYDMATANLKIKPSYIFQVNIARRGQ
jgi:hypothetical protein